MILPEKKANLCHKVTEYFISHSRLRHYTRPYFEIIIHSRTWTAIGHAHVSSRHGPDLFQLLDIASSNLVADNDSDDCRPLYAAHPSPARSTSYTPNSIAATYASKQRATSTFLFGSLGLLGKGPASSSQVSRFRSNVFGSFPSTTPAPPTRDTLFSSKPTSDTVPTLNTSSIFDASYVSKSS